LNFPEILKAWLPVLLWMALIFLGSTDLMSAEHTSRFLTPFLRWLDPNISPAHLAQAHLLVRKAAHVAEYAILTGLIFRALRGWFDGFWSRAAIGLLPALIFASTDEYHQSLIASRTSSFGDLGVDCLGMFVGIVVCWCIHMVVTRRASGS
jgi:VanZ family protein